MSESDIEGHPRRRFLQQAAVGGAVAGAMWVTPQVLSTVPAFAVGSACTTASNVNWSSNPPFAQFTPGKATLASGWNVGTFGGTTVGFTMADPAGRLIYGPGGTFPQYDTGVQPTTSDNGFTGFFSMLMNNAAQNDTATLTITFSKKVKTLAFTIIDLTIGGGAGNGYIDQVVLTAYNNYNNVGGTQAKVPIVATSGGTVTVANNTPGTNDVTATGTATPNGATTTRNLAVSIAGPFDALVIQYRQAKNVTSANGTYQYVGLTNLGWAC